VDNVGPPACLRQADRGIQAMWKLCLRCNIGASVSTERHYPQAKFI